MQEEVGLQIGDRRRVPPRLLAHGLHLPARRDRSRSPGDITVQFHNDDGDVEFTPAALRVDGKLALEQTIFGEDFAFLQGSVDDGATPKLTIPSPSMVHYRGGRAAIDPRVYPDLDAVLGRPRARLRASESARLGDARLHATCSSTTRASPTSTTRSSARRCEQRGEDPAHLHETYIRNINDALAGRPAGMAITTHMCRGNFRSSWAAEGGYDFVAEALFGELEVDGFFLEYDDERSGGFEPLRFVPRASMVVLGLVTTKRGELEAKDELKRRIEEASRYVPIEQLCLSPQCGFSSTVEGNVLTYDEQVAKLALVVETAAEVWG